MSGLVSVSEKPTPTTPTTPPVDNSTDKKTENVAKTSICCDFCTNAIKYTFYATVIVLAGFAVASIVTGTPVTALMLTAATAVVVAGKAGIGFVSQSAMAAKVAALWTKAGAGVVAAGNYTVTQAPIVADKVVAWVISTGNFAVAKVSGWIAGISAAIP